MNPIKSIQARIGGWRNTRKSRYWEYAEYYKDGEVWENVFLLESFGGSNFQGNPYYIYKELLPLAEAEEISIVIAHKNPDKLKAELSARGVICPSVQIVEMHSAEYRKVLSHAKYLVNNVSFSMDFIKKEGQIYLNTWHGTPLKTLGRSIANDPFACVNGQRNFLMSDYLLAPNELTKEVFEKGYMVKDIMPGELFLGGYPRNEIFFDREARARVKEKYGLNGVKSILYMPTWRGDANAVKKVDQVSDIERLAKELGEGYRVYVKFHPAMKTEGTGFTYCRQAPTDIEVYEFLNAVDILITDYSSVLFDFANAEKEIILYQYDKEEYFKERGTYTEAEENIPFKTAYTFDELLELVQKANEEKHPAFLERFCAYDHARAAKTAVDKLLQGKPVHNGKAVDLYVVDFPVTQEELLAIQDKLKGETYRFVFVLGQHSAAFSKINCWGNLEYTSLNVYNRLTPKERRKEAWLRFVYTLFKSKRALKKLQALGERERKRLFGDIKIGNMYAKGKKLPTAVRYEAQPWREDL